MALTRFLNGPSAHILLRVFRLASVAPAVLVAIGALHLGSTLAFCGEIHNAVKNRDIGKVRALIKENPSLVSSLDESGNTPLHIAASSGAKDIAELLLASKASVNTGNHDGLTPLMSAAFLDHMDLVGLFIASGADVNAQDGAGETALHYGARGAKGIAIPTLLLKSGAHVRVRDQEGRTPLQEAAFAGHAEVVKLLLENGAEVNARDNGGFTAYDLTLGGYRIVPGWSLEQWHTLHEEADVWLATYGAVETPGAFTVPGTIHNIVLSGNLDRIRATLESYPTLTSQKTPDGLTPLIYAARTGQVRVVEFLLARGADVNAQGEHCWSALDEAVTNRSIDIVRLLISKGANVNAGAKEGCPMPLDWAAQVDDREIAELLIAYGADVNANRALIGFSPVATDGKLRKTFDEYRGTWDWTYPVVSDETPLHVASWLGHRDIAELLVSKGANLEATDISNETPLCVASLCDRREMAELLIAKGANVNVKGPASKAKPPLSCASESGFRDVAELLIAKGADVNARDTNGDTPLHRAATFGSRSVGELLIANGADMNAKDRSGKKPLAVAKEFHNTDFVEMMRQHERHK